MRYQICWIIREVVVLRFKRSSDGFASVRTTDSHGRAQRLIFAVVTDCRSPILTLFLASMSTGSDSAFLIWLAGEWATCPFTGQPANGHAVGLVRARKFLALKVLERAVFCAHVRGLQMPRTFLQSVLYFCASERIRFSVISLRVN